MVNGNNTFRYNYSAAAHKEIDAIRQKYLPRQESKLEKLRRLDHRVQTAGMVPALTAGISGLLLFGIAICMGLGVLWGGLAGAILLSIPGIAAMAAAYPLFCKSSVAARKKLAPEILRLADEISKGTADAASEEHA